MTINAKIEFVESDKDNRDFVYLCTLLNTELSNNLSKGTDPISSRANKTDDFLCSIVAYVDSTPIGCLALRNFSEGVCELKRMYVSKEYRRSGLGKLLLQKFFDKARNLGYKKVVLETNEKLVPAKLFYYKNGFTKTDSYGPYAYLDETLCMIKNL